MKIIEGPRGFSSGKPVNNKSFLHTFEEAGMFCVISEGAPGKHCIVNVLKQATKAEKPRLSKQYELAVYTNSKVHLACDTPDAAIHYTIDGSKPSKKSPLYSPATGVLMAYEGINIIRAIAFSDKHLSSEVFTSYRFYVVQDPEAAGGLSHGNKYVETLNMDKSSASNEAWWACIPKIVCTSYGVGCIEVTWNPSAENNRHSRQLVSHYQLFLNDISYRGIVPPHVDRLLVKGLAGGRTYDAVLMVYPKEATLMPQQSNIVTFKSGRTTNLGGPIISLKENGRSDQITLCWQSIDSPKCAINCYDLLINEQKRDVVGELGVSFFERIFKKIFHQKLNLHFRYNLLRVGIKSR